MEGGSVGDFVAMDGRQVRPGTPDEQRAAILRVTIELPHASQRAERRHVLESLGLLDKITELFGVQPEK